jgi:hypothetical protein
VATILVAAQGLDEAQLANVEAACSLARLRSQRWAGDSLDDRSAPDLLVAGVPPGERRIPEELVALIARKLPDVGLLLLCSEPLIRPLATLHQGRVTLIGPPLTADAIANRLRVLVAERHQTELPSDGGERSVLTVQYLRPQWWVAGISCEGSNPARALPLFRQDDSGLTVLIFLRDHAAPDWGSLDRVVELLRADDPRAALEQRLAEVLGAGTGLVHLSANAQEWLFYWPRRACPLWLLSPARLPKRWDLSNTLDLQPSRVLRMRAVAADLLVALSVSPPQPDAAATDAGAPARPALPVPMMSGGPALMDHFVEQLRERPLSFCGMIAEVR